MATEGLLFPDADAPSPRAGRVDRAAPARTDARAPRAEAKAFADVALDRPVRTEFTYGVPRELLASTVPGVRVAVPFGATREIGVVVRVRDHSDVSSAKLRNVARVLDAEPLIDATLLELTRWVARTYACSWGEALSAVLPSALKHGREARRVVRVSAVTSIDAAVLAELETKSPKQFRALRTLLALDGTIELQDLCRRTGVTQAPVRSLEQKGLVKIASVDAVSDRFDAPVEGRVRPAELSLDQASALERITACLRARESRTFLLQGVTGSGKTEVYLRAIETALAQDLGAIVVVPEIALTPQTVGWFRSRFGGVGVLHSRMTDAERRRTWLSVKRGDARVVVGARSAVFAPVERLGVLVVDEEHEPSYKQSDSPRYHARDVAIERARLTGGVCILGSATPSLESWHAARTGRFEKLSLRTRVSGGALPKIEIVDLRGEKPEDGARGPIIFSRRLKTLLRGALERREQAILFQNRRGFAPVLWCQACGETVRCKSCDVSLTFHRKIGRAVCHSCCEEIAPPRACPSCTAPGLRYLGIGSERIETALKELLPDARIRRMDSDTMLRREDYEQVLDAFGRGEIDVLVGTQMIAKGLDFPRVTVVGIISADSALYLPDFRSSERTFQLLAQVAGRAGRGVLKGEIVVQTGTPSHPTIRFAAQHDFEGFAAAEDRLRAELGYPPHGRLVRVVFEDEDESVAAQAAKECGELLRAKCAEIEREAAARRGTERPPRIAILGPAQAPVALVRGRHRHHLVVKATASADVLAQLQEAAVDFALARSRPRIIVDPDPASLL